MKSAITTQPERRAAAREKLFAATIELIAELGPTGFSLANAGERAGVSRGLPTYHFATRAQLLAAVARRLVDRLPASADPGLPGLLQWIGAELDLAAAAAPQARALLRLIVVPDIPSLSEERGAYWATRLSFIEHHLQVGQALNEIRADIERDAIAPMLLAQLHGELSRIAWGPGSKHPAFLDLIQRALVVEAKRPSIDRKLAPAPAKAQSSLF